MSVRCSACWIGATLLIALAVEVAVSAWQAPATRPTTRSYGPDVIVLKQLQQTYDTVPFDHRAHAQMSEMWNGCVTCHHRTPATRPATGEAHPNSHDQNSSANYPACKTCHPIADKDVHIGMPNLKGAYHRQCLNCHREWMHDNACNVCHRPRQPGTVAKPEPTVDDIVGRMHPPIAAPDEITYHARFTPAVGGNAIFRHKEHVSTYGLRCVDCHSKDSCTACHSANAKTLTAAASRRPMRPGMTWRDSHGPCVQCHREEQERCRHCHYKDNEAVPPPFHHASTGQVLDVNHANLKCGQCHPNLKSRTGLSCGDASCHKDPKSSEFPLKRPGPTTATRPSAVLPGPQKGIVR